MQIWVCLRLAEPPRAHPRWSLPIRMATPVRAVLGRSWMLWVAALGTEWSCWALVKEGSWELLVVMPSEGWSCCGSLSRPPRTPGVLLMEAAGSRSAAA